MEENIEHEHSHCNYCGTTVWMWVGIVTASTAIVGNVLTIAAILSTKKLHSSVANYFVFSLAVSDCFIGCFIPYHMLFYIIRDFGCTKVNCLLRFVLISFACSSSILNLLFIAGDRYVAIVYPFHYTRYVSKKIALILIAVGWMCAFSMASVPMIWNDWRDGATCEVTVLPTNYIKFILCPMFIVIWVTMLFLYSRICKEASGHEKRMRCSTSTSTCSSLTQAAHLGESKSFQMTLMILGTFTVCWLPYFVVTVYARTNRNLESATLYEIFFNLAMISSSMNPLIYAWKNANFRKSFCYLLRCHKPESNNSANYITNHVPSKKTQ